MYIHIYIYMWMPTSGYVDYIGFSNSELYKASTPLCKVLFKIDRFMVLGF